MLWKGCLGVWTNEFVIGMKLYRLGFVAVLAFCLSQALQSLQALVLSASPVASPLIVPLY